MRPNIRDLPAKGQKSTSTTSKRPNTKDLLVHISHGWRLMSSREPLCLLSYLHQVKVLKEDNMANDPISSRDSRSTKKINPYNIKKPGNHLESANFTQYEVNLTCLNVVGMLDPLRMEVFQAIKLSKHRHQTSRHPRHHDHWRQQEHKTICCRIMMFS